MSDAVSAVLTSAPYLLEGMGVTLALVALALLIGFLCGIVLTIGQVYGPRYIKRLVDIYVWFFRGLPNIVLLFLFYFALFPMTGFDVPAFAVAVVVLGLRSAAYQSQIFRGAIESIADGQMLAARSLGMTKWQSIRTVILPQAIGVAELLTRTAQVISKTGEPMVLYLTCAVIFIILNYGGMMLIQRVEKKVRIPGFGNNEVTET